MNYNFVIVCPEDLFQTAYTLANSTFDRQKQPGLFFCYNVNVMSYRDRQLNAICFFES